MSEFNNLLKPLKINSMAVENRIVMPPMATNFADAKGGVTDANIAYFVERARGGVGYITIEHTGVKADGRAFLHMLMIHVDEHIPGFRRLTDAIHEAGGKVVIQINHAGRQTLKSVTGLPIVAPSPLPCPIRQEIPRELTVPEIKEIIQAFTQAAGRVKDAGADGVELHMAHGYLLNQFLSPAVNKRTDEYGGNPAARMRAPLEVLRAVRELVGPDFPIICRVSADEYLEDGLRLEDSQLIAKALEENGANAIHVSACHSASPVSLLPSYYNEEGAFVHLAEGIKKAVNIPVIAVGRIRTPELAERVIAEGKADLVSMGRALIVDPYLPRKVKEGRPEDIAPCISCNNCSLSLVQIGSLRCAVNPEVSREMYFSMSGKAENPKKVWIIGGGPAGMKAAQVASIKGHSVRLFEKENELGGRFRLAALPPKKAVLQEFTDYLIRQMDSLDIEVIKGAPFDPELIDQGKPDVIILASGACSTIPEGCTGMVSDEQVFTGEVKAGKKVLILGGGGIGSELADMLVGQGKEVTILEMREELGMDMHPAIQATLKQRLKDQGVKVLTSTKILSFNSDCVLTDAPDDGRMDFSAYDTVVASLGAKPNLDLLDKIKSKIQQVHIIGDAKEPRQIMQALLEAEEIVMSL